MPETSHTTRGYTAALASAVVLSTAAIFIRHLTQAYGLPPLVLACLRDFIVAACLALVLAVFRPHRLRLERRFWGYTLLFGISLALFNALWTLSVALNGAAISTVLSYISAVFTALLGRWLLKETLDWGKGLAVTLSLAGCVLISGSLNGGDLAASVPGIIVGVLSGLFYAIYTLMGRTASQRGMNAWTSVLYTFGVAAFVLLAINLLSGGFIPGAAAKPADLFWLGRHWVAWGLLFLLAAGPTLTGFVLYNISLTDLPSSVVNLIATSEPVFTTLQAYLLLGERLTLMQVIGSLLILGAVVFLRLWERRFKDRELIPVEPPVL